MAFPCPCFCLGTLCIIDDKVWDEFTAQHQRMLLDLAKLVLRELKLWREERWSEIKEHMQTAVANFTEKTVAKRDAPTEQEGFKLAVDTVRDVLAADLVALVRVRDTQNPVMDEDEGEDEVEEDTLAMAQDLDVSTETLVPPPNPQAAQTPHSESSDPFTTPLDQSSQPASNPLRSAIGETWSMDFLEPACQSVQGVVWQGTLSPDYPRKSNMPELPHVFNRIGGVCSGVAVPVYRVLGSKQYTVSGALDRNRRDSSTSTKDTNQRPFAILCAFFKDKRRVIEDSDRRFLQNFAVSLTALAQRGRVELANRSKSSFVNSISHELRTPLHGILAVVELLEDTHLSSSQRQFLRTIESCGRSLVSVVNHVLDLAKIEYGRMEVLGRPAPVDLWALCEEVCDAMSPTVKEGIQFGLNVHGGFSGSRWCVSDNGSLRQILINVCFFFV